MCSFTTLPNLVLDQKIFFIIVPIKKELSDGEIDSDNEEKAGTIPSVGGSNALANLMGYASDSTGEEETPGRFE